MYLCMSVDVFVVVHMDQMLDPLQSVFVLPV